MGEAHFRNTATARQSLASHQSGIAAAPASPCISHQGGVAATLNFLGNAVRRSKLKVSALSCSPINCVKVLTINSDLKPNAILSLIIVFTSDV